MQLSKVRVGQPVTLTADLYGGDVEVPRQGRRHLAAAPARPSRVIPAQNATGNWIKVVQRLPVRIALDPNELTAHPLRVGLSHEGRDRSSTRRPSAHVQRDRWPTRRRQAGS